MLEIPLSELGAAYMKALIDRDFHLPIADMSQDMLVGRFPSEVSRALELPTSAVGLLIDIVARAGRDVTVYFQQLYVPRTKRQLHFNTRR